MLNTTLDQSFAVPENRVKQRRFKRTLLSDAIKNGVPEPEELEPDVLIKGASHQIFTGPEQGKTWVALWLVKRAIEREETVVFFDQENGKRIVSERLNELGVSSDAIDEHLYYFDFPSLDLSAEARREYGELLSEIEPDFIAFDSWIGFLALCGLNENSPTDIEV